ncbi:MBL fold metallo-hydrolase [Alkalibacillus salilacus]|uniref:Glyoxylase-like metal-dependent hydrolase (Beta-lactamase superfamily II) n=1 Tax=Alkalibacillus salilacus TaxID=284582 RepID=A0ABT9VBC3_9BACI|nr:MBL fold metallo-hydrolase [Alkalibacillus salilacus]MDQ0158222.1 glyoxylase-like metal-dependent hydrolase (beta-lactamase superfamily II) [Alkalibacillus salilacus]
MSKLETLDYGVTLIDLYDLNLPNRTGSYIIRDEALTVIETSASPSIPFLIEGLKEMGEDPGNVEHIIVTHVHLDHAGGVGLLLQNCPNATVHVHPRGKRHLADPTKLVQGARAVYGDQFDELFDPVLPVPEDRFVEQEDGSELTIGSRSLTFYDTPGHAKHHLSIHDSKANAIYTGDTIGVYYPHLLPYGETFVLPSTSPNQFDPEAMLESLRRIEALEVDAIHFGHFGRSTEPQVVYEQMRDWLPIFLELSEEAVRTEPDHQVEAVRQALINRVVAYLDSLGVARDDEVYQLLEMDMSVCALGLVDYLKKT